MVKLDAKKGDTTCNFKAFCAMLGAGWVVGDGCLVRGS